MRKLIVFLLVPGLFLHPQSMPDCVATAATASRQWPGSAFINEQAINAMLLSPFFGGMNRPTLPGKFLMTMTSLFWLLMPAYNQVTSPKPLPGANPGVMRPAMNPTQQVQTLVRALETAKWETAQNELILFGRINRQITVSLLVSSLNGKSWLIKSRLANVLGNLGDASAIPALLNILNDLDTHDLLASTEEELLAWTEVYAALQKMSNPSARPYLVQALRSEQQGTRSHALELLEKSGIDSSDLPFVVDIARNRTERGYIRIKAFKILSIELGQLPRERAANLLRLTDRARDFYVRHGVALLDATPSQITHFGDHWRTVNLTLAQGEEVFFVFAKNEEIRDFQIYRGEIALGLFVGRHLIIINYESKMDDNRLWGTALHELGHRFVDIHISEKRKEQLKELHTSAKEEFSRHISWLAEESADQALAEIHKLWSEQPERLFLMDLDPTKAIPCFVEEIAKANISVRDGKRQIHFSLPKAWLSHPLLQTSESEMDMYVEIPEGELTFPQMVRLYLEHLPMPPKSVTERYPPALERAMNFLYGGAAWQEPVVFRLDGLNVPKPVRHLNEFRPEVRGLIASWDGIPKLDPSPAAMRMYIAQHFAYSALAPSIRGAWEALFARARDGERFTPAASTDLRYLFEIALGLVKPGPWLVNSDLRLQQIRFVFDLLIQAGAEKLIPSGLREEIQGWNLAQNRRQRYWDLFLAAPTVPVTGHRAAERERRRESERHPSGDKANMEAQEGFENLVRFLSRDQLHDLWRLAESRDPRYLSRLKKWVPALRKPQSNYGLEGRHAWEHAFARFYWTTLAGETEILPVWAQSQVLHQLFVKTKPSGAMSYPQPDAHSRFTRKSA